MSIELVNGRAGTAHVSGADVGRAYAGMCGSGNYCIGAAPTVSMSSANRLSLTSCDLMCDGMHMTLDGLDEWVVENGSQGMKRRDLCCIKYSRDDSTGIEAAETVTLKGEAASSDPADPDVPSGKRSAGASTAYVPVARVELDGLTPTPTLLLTALSPLATVQSELAALSDNVDYVSGRSREYVLFDKDSNTSASVKLDTSARPVSDYQWVDLVFKTDTGRYFTNSFYHPVRLESDGSLASKDLIVFACEDNTQHTHVYVKTNCWRIKDGVCSRIWSMVWGSDGQRQVNDSMLRLVAVIGRGEYREGEV